MKLSPRDAASGERRELSSSLARLTTEVAAEGTLRRLRVETHARAWRAALDGFGIGEGEGPALHLGARRPPAGTLWLALGAGPDGGLDEARRRGFEAADAAFWFLRAGYRADLALDWDALAAARDERLRLESSERLLAERGGAVAPNAAGLAGYRQRLRKALADDCDTAAALDRLWDALRPGALSPASQLAAAREARVWLGLAPAR